MAKKRAKKPVNHTPKKIDDDPRAVHYRELVAGNVRRTRERRGLTQQQLGDKIGWHWSTINRVENAQHNIAFVHACILADALNIGLEELRIAVPE